MGGEFANLSELELLSLIRRAQEELERRKEAAKLRLRDRIEEELKKAGLNLGDVFPEIGAESSQAEEGAPGAAKRSTSAKFKNHVSGDTWSGRGPHPPRWVKAIMAERGWTLEEFKASEEYLAQG
jgi:DNA-binding protein H-NS